jgi:hypothetical protein
MKDIILYTIVIVITVVLAATPIVLVYYYLNNLKMAKQSAPKNMAGMPNINNDLPVPSAIKGNIVSYIKYFRIKPWIAIANIVKTIFISIYHMIHWVNRHVNQNRE